MNIPSLIAVYFVVWWVTLFAILPIGVVTQQEADDVVEGTEPGAPQRPRLVLKMLITTIVAAIVCALLFWGLTNPVIQEYWR
ncbi:MAG: DUF1467 family protein [Hyphomicrobiaceae bacterium]|nr:DUF1467 family protein [Hyphomicrobiaceae bacterium]MCC0023496.1 DUF1467 family protein [Hyphomicrobiaceae bacterium]